ncbi:MAG TPA: potassium-transporting ATPase subunit KdpC [Bryobacteraceae bacterium]|jgi:K+-transporting ATPase ATPase C chain|nr:potassium-transporting ATPase subunit KdpC [Bryobacteraceae bacterium]
MLKELKPAILITFVLTILTGILYPLAVTGIAQTLFHKQANGSLIERGGKVVGSELIGQNFTKPEYFHPRPSQNSYDAANSGGSNLGPTNPALADRLKKDAAQFRKDNPDFTGPIPADAITTSASGLDPDISPANALAQVGRVAQARGASTHAVRNLVAANTQQRDLGVLGEPRVNTLNLNIALDQAYPIKH